MQSTFLWSALIVLAGAAVTAPSIQNVCNRAILYWLILPSLAVGIVAMFGHVIGF
jgi:hypothetical protein